jgi:hypothetical protein
MIAFLTQYYQGLGHSQRIKFIAEETAKYNDDVIIIDQLFQPPLKYTVEHVSFLKNYKVPNKLFCCLRVNLVSRIRYSCTECN